MGPFPRENYNSILDHRYTNLYVGGDGISRTSENIFEELKKLDLDIATVGEVENLIGCGNIIRLFCTECHDEFSEIIEFDNDEYPYYLCRDCCKKATELFTR